MEPELLALESEPLPPKRYHTTPANTAPTVPTSRLVLLDVDVVVEEEEEEAEAEVVLRDDGSKDWNK